LYLSSKIKEHVITGALVIFIVDGRWASFTISDSLVVIVSFFRRLLLLPAYKKGGCEVVVKVGRQRNNREKERIKFSKPARKDDGLFSGSC
jgi:hypothetical protein